MQNTRQFSRFLSLVLRHNPGKIQLKLDGEGWTEVDHLLERLKTQKRFRGVTREDLERVVADNDKQRFRFDESRSRIRANQGHSINIDLALEPVEPPETLLHGTVAKFLDSIHEKGLIKGSRQHVHLSENQETAEKVGQRRGKPVLLEVAAGKMHADGYAFFCSDNGVWLTDHVPPEYLIASSVPEAR